VGSALVPWGDVVQIDVGVVALRDGATMARFNEHGAPKF